MGAIEDAEQYLASRQQPTDLSQLSDEEIIRNLPDDVLLQQLQSQAYQPAAEAQSFFEQAHQRTEQQIAERPSSIGYLRQVAQQPALAQQHPFRTGLSAIAAPFEAGESIPANIGLALQRGDVRQLPQQLLQGVIGERPVQVGDIYRASGIPALQAMAAPAGLLLTGGTGIRSLRQGSVGKIGRVAEEAARPALKLADIIQSTTSEPSRLTRQVLGQIPKVSGKIGETIITRPLKRMASPLTEFPYRKTLEVRQGLIGYFRDINSRYGDELEKLSANLQGVLPTQQVSQAIQRRLQEANILDQAGQLIPDAVKSLSASEQKMLTLYEELVTSPNPTIPFGTFIKQLRTFRSQIRQQARQRNVPIQADERVVSGVLHDMGVLIEPNVQGSAAQSLAKINQEYAQQRQVFNLGNRLFKVFKGELDTKSGERVMSSYHTIAQDRGTELLLEQLEKAAGVQFVRKAKAYSAVQGVGRELGQARPLGIPIGPMVRYGGTLARQGIPALAALPFNMPGQVQQAVIRELLKVVGGSDRPRRRLQP